MARGISIVICSYNGAKRLPPTLTHLIDQRVPEGIAWEVIVIDNASTDTTAETVRSFESRFAPTPLRVVDEASPGLSNARVRGVREARYDIISLIDDDNWVAPDWVARVYGIFDQHPEIDLCGGRSEPVFETDRPKWLGLVDGYYAIGSQHPENGEVTNKPGTLLWGAGLTMRTQAFRNLLESGFAFKLTSRKGNLLTSSGETELCFALREFGCRFWYDNDLVLQHFIPKQRLEWSYPLRLMRGMGQSSVFIVLYLTALNRVPYKDRPQWKRGWMFAFLRAVKRLGTVVLFHPLDCYFQPEGSAHALKFRHGCGALAALWALRGRYNELRDEIQQSLTNRAPSLKAA
jgi:glycosyltransferase involved in cell wall biosynthesis